MELQRKSEELCAEAKRANELHKKVTLLDDNQIDMRMQYVSWSLKSSQPALMCQFLS